MALSRASSPSKIWWKKSSEKSEKMIVCPPLTPFANATAAWSFAAAFRSKKCRSCSPWNGTLPVRNPLPPSLACSITSPAMSLRRENTWTTAACALKSWKPTSEKFCVSASAALPPQRWSPDGTKSRRGGWHFGAWKNELWIVHIRGSYLPICRVRNRNFQLNPTARSKRQSSKSVGLGYSLIQIGQKAFKEAHLAGAVETLHSVIREIISRLRGHFA